MRVPTRKNTLFLVSLWLMAFVFSPFQVKAGDAVIESVLAYYPSLETAPANTQSFAEIAKLTLYEMDGAFKFQGDLRAFYEQRDFRPLWMADGRPDASARQLLDLIETSWSHGLNPHQYNLQRLSSLADSNLVESSAVHQVVFDLMLSDSFSKLAYDMTSIRVDPEKVNIDPSHWRTPASATNILRRVGHKQESPGAVFESLKPDNALYDELRLALMKEISLLNDRGMGGSPESFGEPGGKPEQSADIFIHPKTEHALIPKIRAHLIRFYGLDGESQSRFYDTHLIQLVKQFQRRHNIIEDGVIGPDTLAMMNKGRIERIYQLMANLERLRWIDFNRPDKYIVINIPSARLWAIDNGRIEHQMPVVVGRPERPTISFVASIKGVRFNPSWTIPDTIKTDDIFPQAQDNPDIFTDKNIQVFAGYNADAPTLDPQAVNWQSLSSNAVRRYKLVQRPGDDNPLGRVRFLMFNPYDIYLHDTNEPHHFKRSYRALSSGCVRLSEPEKLAEFVLGGSRGWQKGDTAEYIRAGEEVDIRGGADIPVYLLYLTNWFRHDGNLTYGPDIYGYDSNLIDLLRHKDAIFIPENDFSMVSSSPVSQKSG